MIFIVYITKYNYIMRIILILTFIFFSHKAFSFVDYTYLICKKEIEILDKLKINENFIFLTLRAIHILFVMQLVKPPMDHLLIKAGSSIQLLAGRHTILYVNLKESGIYFITIRLCPKE